MVNNLLVAKLKAVADNIDPQTDGIVVLIVGDVQYGPYGITRTGDAEFDVDFDAKRLANAMNEAVARGNRPQW